jgi:hypothetical protein
VVGYSIIFEIRMESDKEKVRANKFIRYVVYFSFYISNKCEYKYLFLGFV